MYDKEIGMYYLRARYYNPEYGVFLSVDPDPDGHLAWWVTSGLIGGTGGKLASVASLGRKSTAFLSLHTGVAGYAVATSSKDYSGKGLGRETLHTQ